MGGKRVLLYFILFASNVSERGNEWRNIIPQRKKGHSFARIYVNLLQDENEWKKYGHDRMIAVLWCTIKRIRSESNGCGGTNYLLLCFSL